MSCLQCSKYKGSGIEWLNKVIGLLGGLWVFMTGRPKELQNRSFKTPLHFGYAYQRYPRGIEPAR